MEVEVAMMMKIMKSSWISSRYAAALSNFSSGFHRSCLRVEGLKSGHGNVRGKLKF